MMLNGRFEFGLQGDIIDFPDQHIDQFRKAFLAAFSLLGPLFDAVSYNHFRDRTNCHGKSVLEILKNLGHWAGVDDLVDVNAFGGFLGGRGWR